ncbi:hypothetical protein ACS0TY_025766 [Phlomoides rotata]
MQTIGVKKLYNNYTLSDEEFVKEAVTLSKLRHPNLVNLIGYCSEEDERIVVYEYEYAPGDLYSYLHVETHSTKLDWNKRMKIAAGVAEGLNFLHEAEPLIIYRHLKPTNILFGAGFRPKLSDFGLGAYHAPEYAATQNPTFKSDVYSFGIVLLELISGYRPNDTFEGNRMPMLIDRAREWVKKEPERLWDVADEVTKRDFPLHSLIKAVELALLCVEHAPESRPNMKDVVEAMNALTAPDEASSSIASATQVGETSRGGGGARRH